jgi:predicted secreted acid phosphatase
MVDRVSHLPRAGALAILLAATLLPAVVAAAECPTRREPSIPQLDGTIAKGFNIDTTKRQLAKYHDDGTYEANIAAVMADATRLVERRLGEGVKWPAVVLDIDETSLSNWENLKADDFGFIEAGPCSLDPKMACGFMEWIDKAVAPPIGPTLSFYRAVRAKNVAVFFITGRRDHQRRVTLWNLDNAGFQGWARLATRPDDQHGSIVPFKSGQRDKIVAEGYTIIANVGDQDSDLQDLKDKSADCSFKLPNPFYFIP